MAHHRTIDTKLFKDRWVRSLSPLDKLLFIYFLTNISTNIAGAYEIELSDIELDTGITASEIDEALGRFRAAEKIFYEDGWVYIANFIKHQSLSPKIQDGIIKIVNNTPLWIKNRVSIQYNTLSHLILLDSILLDSINAAPSPKFKSAESDLLLIFLGTVDSGLSERMGIKNLPNQRDWHQRLSWAFNNSFTAGAVLECYDLLKLDEFWQSKSISAKTLIENLANLESLRRTNKKKAVEVLPTAEQNLADAAANDAVMRPAPTAKVMEGMH